MQTLEEVTANITLPPGTTAKLINVKIGVSDFKVSLKASPNEPIVEGKWHKKVKAEDSTWVIESDGNKKTL